MLEQSRSELQKSTVSDTSAKAFGTLTLADFLRER